MITNDVVWAIFVADNIHRFPNFYPISVSTTKEKALEELGKLPKEYNYQLFEIPINKFFGYFDKKGNLKSGMGELLHQHFHYKEDDE